MRKQTTMVTLLALITMSLAGTAYAGKMAETEQAQIDQVVEVSISNMKTERKALVALNLDLKDKESKEFWKVYQDYQTEMGNLERESMDLIRAYADNFNALTDEKAGQLTDRWFKIEAKRVKIKQQYRKRFSKIISAKNVARLFQIENKLDLLYRATAASQIPLAE